MYQSFNTEECFLWWIRKYIEAKRKAVRGLNMILKESDLRCLVREVMGISDNVIEFETEMGSIYTYDRNLRMSSREKRSGGSGQGEVKPFMNVVFTGKKIPLYNPTLRCIVAHKRSDGSIDAGFENRGISKVPMSLSEDEKLGIVITKRQRGEIVEIVDAFLEPGIGLRPFEWVIDDEGRRIRHLGNKIVDIRERT